MWAGVYHSQAVNFGRRMLDAQTLRLCSPTIA